MPLRFASTLRNTNTYQRSSFALFLLTLEDWFSNFLPAFTDLSMPCICQCCSTMNKFFTDYWVSCIAVILCICISIQVRLMPLCWLSFYFIWVLICNPLSRQWFTLLLRARATYKKHICEWFLFLIVLAFKLSGVSTLLPDGSGPLVWIVC